MIRREIEQLPAHLRETAEVLAGWLDPMPDEEPALVGGPLETEAQRPVTRKRFSFDFSRRTTV